MLICNSNDVSILHFRFIYEGEMKEKKKIFAYKYMCRILIDHFRSFGSSHFLSLICIIPEKKRA